MSVAVVKLNVSLVIPEVQETTSDMSQKWQNGLIVNATIINDRRKTKIGDDGTFALKVAAPATAGFSPMVDSAFVSRKGRSASAIIAAHQINTQEAFAKWNNNLDLAFAVVDGVAAKRFIDNVSNKAGNWDVAAGKKTLRMTGDKVRGRGVSAILPELLVGYGPSISWLRPGDNGTLVQAYKICVDGLEGSLKAALTQMITRLGLDIISQKLDATVIAADNALLVALLNGFADVTRCDPILDVVSPGTCYCAFEVVDNALRLSTEITKT